jgi:glucose-1-phosphate adenylyltransferase
MAIVSLTENEDQIKSITKNRPLASIPIGGRYRIIDFTLSNLVNCGIRNVGIFTESKSRSLIDHLGSGKPWDLDRKLNGLFIFNYSMGTSYLNDIEMLKNNLEYLYRSKEDKVILTCSFMIANLSYLDAAEYHEKSGKDITIIYKKIKDGKFNFKDRNVLSLDSNNNVLGVGKNIGTKDELNASMDMFIMSKKVLIEILNKCIETGYWGSIREWIYKSIEELDVNAFEFDGYLQCVNSINSYYRANMDMLNLDINKELFFKNGLIYTKVKDEAPTKYVNGSSALNTLISNGCIVKGSIKNSVISRRVVVEQNVEIENCIIMQNCIIKSGSRLKNVIIDKNIIIEENTELKGDLEFPLVIEKRTLI